MSSKIDQDLYRVPRVAVPTVFVVCFTLVAWAIGLIGCVTGFVSLPIAFLLNAAAAHAAFTGFHDASHFALGKKKWMSVVAGELMGLVLLANFQIFRQIHQRHHRHTNDADHDPDEWLGRGPVWSLPFRWLFVDFHYLRAYQPSKSKLCPFEKFALCFGVVSTLSLIVGLIASGNVTVFLILWLLPARLSMFCAAYYADFVPHQRPHAVPRSQHAIAHTANIGGRSIGVFLLGHNMHLIHHLYPGVPFYRCFKIWRERKVELISKGAQVVSFTGAHRAQRKSQNDGLTGKLDKMRILLNDDQVMTGMAESSLFRCNVWSGLSRSEPRSGDLIELESPRVIWRYKKSPQG